MTDLRTAAQQALEALEDLADCGAEAWSEQRPCVQIGREAITALRAALAEPVQEPVAWMMVNPTHPRLHKSLHWKPQTDWHITWESVPLYVAPPQRKPLTEEEMMDEFCKTPGIHQFVSAFLAGARYAERAHGIT